jgi:membrane protein YdbS with pleckstrin-like domain
MGVRVFRAIFKALVTLFALLLIAIGILVTPSPIPFGIVFIAIGFLLLVAVAPDMVRWLRRRWRWFDRQMKKLEKKLPEWIAKQLRKSDVERNDDDN